MIDPVCLLAPTLGFNLVDRFHRFDIFKVPLNVGFLVVDLEERETMAGIRGAEIGVLGGSRPVIFWKTTESRI